MRTLITLRSAVLLTVAGHTGICAGADRGKDPIELPPVIVESPTLKAKAHPGPFWREEMLVPGVIWKLKHSTHLRSFLFDDDKIVRRVVGSKEKMPAGSARVSFQKLTWHLEAEWLVFSSPENPRVEELRLIADGWLGITARNRDGEILRFNVTKPRLKPVKIKR